VVQPDSTDFVKRVIGVGGDHVQCCDAQGRVTVNGQPLEETDYIYPGDAPSIDEFDVVVPQGMLWVMGDHRSNSADSRFHMGDPGGGFVPASKVVGRVMSVLWPVSHFGSQSIPSTFASVPAPSASGS
jgi:signal peptidase I